MIVQISYKDDNHKQFVKFCNQLRCPICNSQLDGNIHPKEAKLYCVSNNDEYYSRWIPSDNIPISEILKFSYPQYEYIITITKYGSGSYRTQISRYNMDVILFYRPSTRKELFDFTGDRVLFFRNRMDEDLFLKKLKLYNLVS